VVKGERKGHCRAGSNWDSIHLSIPTLITYVNRDASATPKLNNWFCG